MAETRGVFTLKTVRNNFLDGTYIDPDESFIDQEFSHNTGYHIAGAQSGALGNGSSAVEKLDYATETFTVLASKLADTPGSTAAIGNGEAAYQAGGYGYTSPGGNRSTVNKVTYATDVVATIPALLGPQRFGMGSVGNIGFGFFCGGYNTGNLATSDKLTFATDLIAGIPGANISPARRVLTGASNQQFGFLFGGYDSSYSASVDKIQFNTDTRSSAPSLPTATADASAVGNSTKAFITGGNTPTITAQTYSLTFSTGTTSTAPGSNLPAASNSMTAFGTEENAFFCGKASFTTTVYKINYTTGTSSVSPAQLNEANSAAGGASSQQSGQLNGAKKRNIQGKQGQPRGTYLNGFAATEGYGTGYFVGGPPAGYTVMDRLTYETDTTVAVPSANSAAAIQASAGLSTPEHLSWWGGNLSSTRCDRTSYAAECTFRVPQADAPSHQTYAAGFQNSKAGYRGGGQDGSDTIVSKLTWATDTGSRIQSLTRARTVPAGMGNKNFGFISGSTNPISSVDRLVYATETVNLSPFAFDPDPHAYVSGSSNATDGVVQGGGSPGTSQCRRLNFATESFELIPSAQALTFSPGAQANGATGNTQNGYSLYGYDGGYRTYCDKINYASLTNFLAPSAQGTTPRRYAYGGSSQNQDLPTKPLATSTLNTSIPGSTSNAGYFGGGALSPGNTDVIDKVDFSTDVTSTIPATLSIARNATGASSSRTAGYFGGGTPGPRSTMDKVTYSDDTATAVPGAALSEGRYYVNGMGNSEKGFWGGGYNGPLGGERATTDKVTYSNDTRAATPGVALYAARYGVGGVANSDYGYFGGGSKPGNTRYSSTDRIVFATDTAARLPSTNMTDSKGYMGSAGNPEKSYFIGGSLVPSSGSTTRAEKLTYSTETYSIVTGAYAPAPQRGSFLSGTGNDGTGYFGAGLLLPASTAGSSVFKVNYSTETSSGSPSSFFPSGRWARSATSARENTISATSNVI